MRYLLLIETNPDAAGSTGPDERLAEEMGKLLEDMTKAGVLLDAAGLRPIEEATRIRLADGKQTVIDGPFTESKEVIGGGGLPPAGVGGRSGGGGGRLLSPSSP